VAIHHVFAYGSLLDPKSLSRTLPDVDPRTAIPAHLHGYRRSFTVAFPNDGSQADKTYFDAYGRRPEFVLFADIEPTDSAAVSPAARGTVGSAAPADPAAAAPVAASPVNGVLVPVAAAQLDLLIDRERRYCLIDVTHAITAWPGVTRPTGRVGAFVGHARYTSRLDVERGVVSSEYLATIDTGVAFWEARRPGFARGYLESTLLPPAARIASLSRMDHRPAGASRDLAERIETASSPTPRSPSAGPTPRLEGPL
jgi:hypothetical protein